MIYLIHGLIVCSAIVLIGKNQPDKFWFFTGVFLKILAGIALGLIYMNFYGYGDTLRYFNEAHALAEKPLAEWWELIRRIEIGAFTNQPRAILFTKIVSGLIFLTQGDYWIVSTYFSVISFFSYWFFYRQIMTTLPNLKWPVLIGFLLLPSTLFWSAGIMKGALTNASVVYLSAFCLKLFFKKKLYSHEILLSALSVVLLLYIKYYTLIVLMPLIIYALFDIRAHKMGITSGLRLSVYMTLLLLTVFIAPSINPNLNLSELPTAIYINQQSFGAGQTIPVLIQPNWLSLLEQLPKSVFIGLYGPTLLDPGVVFGWIPRIENLLLLIFSCFSLTLLVRKKLWQPDVLVIACLLFILILAAMLPLAAPNYGALVRYRAPFTPFLVTMVTILPFWYFQKKL